MTTITIYKSDQGSYKGFTCKGHAGFADSGNDIVCAAISCAVAVIVGCVVTIILGFDEEAEEA